MEEPVDSLHLVLHEAEGARLAPVAVDGEGLAAQRLDDEVGDDAAVAGSHAGSVGVVREHAVAREEVLRARHREVVHVLRGRDRVDAVDLRPDQVGRPRGVQRLLHTGVPGEDVEARHLAHRDPPERERTIAVPLPERGLVPPHGGDDAEAEEEVGQVRGEALAGGVEGELPHLRISGVRPVALPVSLEEVLEPAERKLEDPRGNADLRRVSGDPEHVPEEREERAPIDVQARSPTLRGGGQSRCDAEDVLQDG